MSSSSSGAAAYEALGSFKGYERMVTKRIGLRQVVVDGFEALIKDKDEHIKILVSPKF